MFFIGKCSNSTMNGTVHLSLVCGYRGKILLVRMVNFPLYEAKAVFKSTMAAYIYIGFHGTVTFAIWPNVEQA